MRALVIVVVGVVLLAGCAGPTGSAGSAGSATSSSTPIMPSGAPSARPVPASTPVASTAGPTVAPFASPSAASARRLDDALLAAAYANDVERAAQLIAEGADVNHADDTEQSAYLIATSEVGDDPRLLELAIANGARINAKDSFNGTGLIRAAERGYPRIVARLLTAGIEVDHVNELGWTALHEAIILGRGGPEHTAVVRLLVEAGADVHLPSQRDGVRPLEHAERRGFTEIARILRKAARAMTPDTRLLQAAQRGSLVAAEAALADGADLEARDERERTALLLAVSEDRVDVARMLVARGADVNAYDDQQDTPFLVTGVTGSVAMLDALIPGDPDTRLRNRYGGVAVIPASERGHADYVAAVLERTDIDVNHVNDLGWTALLEAVILGDGGPRHQRIVEILLANGADPTIADRDGVTALEHARQRGFDGIARSLAAAN